VFGGTVGKDTVSRTLAVSQGFEHRPALAADRLHHRHVDLLITGAIAKWAIFAPIFVPAPVPPTATSSAIDGAASTGDASDDGDYDANDCSQELWSILFRAP
jgi:hypothetical protein